MMKFREKLLISMVGIAFFASFVSNFPVTKFAEKKFKENSIEKQQIVLGKEKEEFEKLFSESIGILMNTSLNTSSEEYIKGGLFYALNTLRYYGYKDVLLIFEDGKVYNQEGIVDISFAEEVQEIFNDVASGNKGLEMYFPYTFKNEKVALVISPFSDEGQKKGLIVGVLSSEFYSEKLKDKKFGKTGYFGINFKNFVFAHPDKKMIGFNLLTDKRTEKLGNEILKKDKGWSEYDFNGDKIAFFERLGKYPLYMGAIIKKDEAIAGVNQIRLIGMTLGISTAIIAILISLFISRGISKRIKQVVKTVEEISKGNFDAIPESKHEDEIDLINESLKDMAKNISQTVSEILLKSNDGTGAAKIIEEIVQTISSDELDRNIEDFSAYLEETNAEVETIVNRINDFTELLEGIGDQSSRLARLNKEIAELSDRIADISDTIAVLAINSRIETSRENIDREGLSKISEMIMELSNEVRETARQSKEFLISNEEIITSTVLTSEKINKELGGVRESLQTIQDIVQKNVESVSKLVEASENNRRSLTKVIESLRTTEDILNDLKETVEKFLTSLRISK